MADDQKKQCAAALLAAFLPLAVILFLCAAFKVPDYDGAKNQLTTHGLIYIGPVARLLEFAVGMALQHSIAGRKQLPGFARHVWILQLLALAVAAWFVAQGMALSSRPWMPRVFAVCFNYSGGLPVWAFVIWSFSFSAWPATLLSNRLFVALGDASNASYLVHFSIAHSAAERLFRLFHVENTSLQLTLYLILVIGASFGLYYAVERPGMAVGKFLASCVHSKRALPSPGLRTATVQE
jgi:peptidoglycan/LPS O-acetylase OafA/YrhL